MPNHVTTILTIEDLAGQELSKVRSLFVNEDGKVDLNLIAPVPECLKDFEPHHGILLRASMALGLLENPEGSPELTDLTKRMEFGNAMREATKPVSADDAPHVVRAIENYGKCGFMYWYDWNRENWGTKWNAYGQPEGGYPEGATEFEFQTAWSSPANIIEKISDTAWGVTFSVKFADEDIGSNCGTYRVRSGEIIEADIAPRWDNQTDDQKRKFTEFSFRLLNGDEDPASRGYDENWQYSDEVYEAYEASISA